MAENDSTSSPAASKEELKQHNQSNASLPELPIELTGLICDHLEQESLANLRLTSRHFAQLASRKLFDTISIDIDASNLGATKLENITDSKHSQHIKKLHLRCWNFPLDDKDVLEDSVETDEEWIARYRSDVFNAIRVSQSSLRNLFSKLSNLASIGLEIEEGYGDGHEHDCRYKVSCLNDCRRTREAFLEIAFELFAHATFPQLRSLDLTMNDGLDLESLFARIQKLPPPILKTVTGIKDLCLHHDVYEDEWRSSRRNRTNNANWTSFLSQLHDLRSLTIDWNGERPVPESFSLSGFEHLPCLSLQGCRMDAPMLTSYFSDKAIRSLQRIELLNITIFRGFWADILVALTQCTNLASLRLSALAYTPFGDEPGYNFSSLDDIPWSPLLGSYRWRDWHALRDFCVAALNACPEAQEDDEDPKSWKELDRNRAEAIIEHYCSLEDFNTLESMKWRRLAGQEQATAADGGYPEEEKKAKLF